MASLDPLSHQAFEARAAAAEARLAALEARLQAGKGSPAASADTGLVSQLLELKQLLVQAKAERDVLKIERDQAVKAQEALLVENGKLQYRVKHLVKTVREVDGAAKASVPNGLSQAVAAGTQ